MERLSVIAALFLAAASNAQAQSAAPDMPARPIMSTQIMPPYPAISRRLGEQGTTQFHLTISPDGHVMDCRIIKSSGAERLDAAACEAAHRWRYKPATHNGEPIASNDNAEFLWEHGSDAAILKH